MSLQFFSRAGAALGVQLTAALLLSACGGSSSTPDTTTTTGGGSPADAAAGTNGKLKILFSPMYSAFDGVHDFKLPAVVNGVSDLNWSADDPTKVDIEQDNDTGGVMLTMKASGTVTISAAAGGLVGTSLLTILAATPDQWQAGSDRYHNGTILRNVSQATRDGGNEAACTNCHGSDATALDVQHTPQQTGGYSDQDILNIVTKGTKPPGVGQRIMPFDEWHALHQWHLPDDQLSIVVYLRSLTPVAQGPVDFGGGFTATPPAGREGGMGNFGEGGFNRAEGGGRGGGGTFEAGPGPGPVEAGPAPAEAGSGATDAEVAE